jgi:ABC-2 type transport system ATP-binding protein
MTASAQSGPILRADGLTRRFGAFTAVDSLTLDVPPGEIFGLLGPNGAGKSTSIKMFTTLLPPTAGRAAIAGLDIARDAAQVRRVVGYVPQLLSAEGGLTGYENLLIFAKLYDVPAAQRKTRLDEALGMMGLGDAARKLVRSYSGGMIRRLEIAQALLHRPRVLFLDEPTVGLDPMARGAVWDHIRHLRDEAGMTVVLTTHYMDEADQLCGRVAIMHRGKVAAIDTPDALKDSIGGGTLDQVFAHYAGVDAAANAEGQEKGGFRDIARTRKSARRLG